MLGLIQVESNFRKFAVSPVGARGYMQVMPFWARLIGDGDAGKLFHMQTNLRFGCVILRHYIDRERGDLFMALGRYNGSRGKPQYPNAVLGAGKVVGLPPAAAGRENARPVAAAGQGTRRSQLERRGACLVRACGRGKRVITGASRAASPLCCVCCLMQSWRTYCLRLFSNILENSYAR